MTGLPRATRLIDRRSEMAELEAERRRASAGEFRTVLMLADPGMGKSRIAKEFLARNRFRSLALSARAHPLGETASFGVWAEALERHLRGRDAAWISELCEGFLDDLAVLVRSVALVRGAAPEREPPKLRLLEGIGGLLTKLTARQAAVAFLDDMHLADPSSWEALGYLARSLSGASVLVIVAARAAELAEHQVGNEVVLGLEQEGMLRRLDVGPLGPDEMGELALAALGEEPPSALVGWLAERSRGNPLFALSLLQALAEEGSDYSSPDLRSLPQHLADRVAAELKRLDELGLLTVELLAVAGARVDLGDLLRLTGQRLEPVGAALESLVRSRWVVEEEAERHLTYEIAHPLIRDAIYQAVGGARRRALHRLIGRSYLDTGRLGTAAPHFSLSAETGDSEAIDVLRDAVRQSEEREAYQEALSILDALVDLLPAGDPRWGEVLDAMSWRAEWVVDHRADMHAVMGISAMRRIDAVVEGLGDPARRATVKFRLGSFLAWGTGELEEAEVAFSGARELFEEAGDRTSALLAANELAWVRGLEGDLAALGAEAGRVAEAAESMGEQFALMQALSAMGVAAGWRGRIQEGEDAWRRSMAIAAEEGRPYRVTIAHLSLAMTHALTGRVEQAIALLEEAKSLNPRWRESPIPEWESIVLWASADFRGAVASGRKAAPSALGTPSRRRAFGLSYAALSAVEADLLEEAERFIAQARGTYGDRDWAFYRDYALYARAVLDWRLGFRAESLAGLRRVAERVGGIGAVSAVVYVLVDMAHLAAECDDPEAAREAAAGLERAVHDTDVGLFRALAEVGRSWSGLACGEAGEAATSARRALELLSEYRLPFWTARGQEALGRALWASGDAGALEALQAAEAGFAACGAVWRHGRVIEAMRGLGGPGRRAAAGALGPGSLTRREREVARLAAHGRTARQIADRLCIGERTVEAHLGSVYAKLGVSSKLELVRREAEFQL